MKTGKISPKHIYKHILNMVKYKPTQKIKKF